MEQTKKRIEDAFNIIEHRMISSGKMAATDRKRELQQIDTAVAQLESELDRFQMVAFTRFPTEIDEFEERLASIKMKLKKMNEEGITASQVVEQAKVEETEEVQVEDAAQKAIAETNAKLKEGKERAMGMLRTVNNMKEELNLIDDEIMLQREKMMSIKDKMKKTQSTVYQTKKIARNLAKSLNNDICMKVMIGLISVAIIGVVVMIGLSKMKPQEDPNKAINLELEKQKREDFLKIDEKFFHDLEKNPEATIKAAMQRFEAQKEQKAKEEEARPKSTAPSPGTPAPAAEGKKTAAAAEAAKQEESGAKEEKLEEKTEADDKTEKSEKKEADLKEESAADQKEEEETEKTIKSEDEKEAEETAQNTKAADEIEQRSEDSENSQHNYDISDKDPVKEVDDGGNSGRHRDVLARRLESPAWKVKLTKRLTSF